LKREILSFSVGVSDSNIDVVSNSDVVSNIDVVSNSDVVSVSDTNNNDNIISEMMNEMVNKVVIESQIREIIDNIVLESIRVSDISDTTMKSDDVKQCDDVKQSDAPPKSDNSFNIYEISLNENVGITDSWCLDYGIDSVKIYHCHVPIYSGDMDTYSDDDEF
jgi:hypothetical protein